MKYLATAALLLLAISPAALAQLPSFSTRSVALGGGYTASARGFEAIAWNPALLAMPDRPKFSLNIVQGGVRAGSNTFGMGDFNKYKDKVLTTQDKNDLLKQVRQGDSSRTLSLDVQPSVGGLALSVGSFAASLSAAGNVGADVSSDAVELALFGNVTRKGPGQRYSAAGSGVRGWGAGTFALAYGMKFPVPVGALAVGATLKINRGIVALRAENLNTTLQTSPNFQATAGFHALLSEVDTNTFNGSGVGIDLGGAYQLASGVRFGLVLENLINSTSWDDKHLIYYRQEFRLTQTGDQLVDTTISDIDRVRYSSSDPLQKRLHDSLTTGGTYPMRIRAGVNANSGIFTLAAGLVIRAKQALDFGAAQQASAGAEIRLIPFLPLRAGMATDLAGGFTFSGGLGFKFGPVRLDGAIANSPTGDHKGFQAAVGLSILQ
ncbi:MAG: conjugal transfer protein TraF [Gemmatimonadetes bacterium]|nr:conjugal transfer protein TraF [Gemmatimonadota bacterium]